jgi:predicted GIY-YIG superfamily endonuclease
MTLFSNATSLQFAYTNNVYRPTGGIDSLREIHDDVGRLMVSAFPFAMVKDLSLGRATVPACYILCDHATAYIGESRSVGRRLSDHAADPAKWFAREVYVIHSHHREWFDKTAAVYLQYRLTELAERAGLVEVVRGASPQVQELPAKKRATLEHFVEHSQRLLFDAGCRIFHSSFESQRPQASAEIAISPDEAGPMQINVATAPPLGSELELAYCGLFARGYQAEDGFVVMAGSEVRGVVNPSANPIVTTRRGELASAQALVAIPGLQDRLRLQVAVRFPSAAIAAKVVTGAHVNSSKWVPPRYPEPMLIAD